MNRSLEDQVSGLLRVASGMSDFVISYCEPVASLGRDGIDFAVEFLTGGYDVWSLIESQKKRMVAVDASAEVARHYLHDYLGELHK